MPAKAKLVKFLAYLFVGMLLIEQKPVTEYFLKYCILIGKQNGIFVLKRCVCFSVCSANKLDT